MSSIACQDIEDAMLQYRVISRKLKNEMDSLLFSCVKVFNVYDKQDGVTLHFKCPCCCHVTQQEILSVDSLGTKIVKGQTILREVQKCSVCGFSEKHQKFNGSPLEVLSDNFAYSENFKDFSRYRFIDALAYSNSVFFVIIEPASLPNDSVLVRHFVKRIRTVPYETPKEFARFF